MSPASKFVASPGPAFCFTGPPTLMPLDLHHRYVSKPLALHLEADIYTFIDKHNQDPKPFKWTKSADDILAAVMRFRLRVDQNLCHEL